MKIVVGLGNPGRRYVGTRHNVGFAVVDALAEGHPSTSFQERFQAQIADLREDSQKVLLVKPQTFMNLSGRTVREIVEFFQVPLEDVLVVCDDINLPLGKIRFRARGTHGGHNGLRDIQQHLGTTAYARLRIGVGAPQEQGAVEHVLGKFGPSQRPIIEDALASAVQAVVFWIHQGIDPSMNQFNG